MIMSSYFDEHDCQPLKNGEQPDHLLHIARLLVDGGYATQWEMDYENIIGGKPTPPASKKAIEDLKTETVTPRQADSGMQCPVCMAEYEEETIKKMPCGHHFHPNCLMAWLEKTNTCPVCRYELPTDDEQYEEMKRQKARQKQREYEIDTLHNSMFG